MNEFVKMTVDGYLSAFDAYEVGNPNLAAEISAFKSKLIEYGEIYDDPTKFMTDLMSSGLQEEYTDLISKAYMAASALGNDDGSAKTDCGDKQTPKISVKEFLEQYRIAYDEVCKDGTRPNCEAAYREVFNVANRTDNMLEAQLILERERLLWKIVSEDGIDINRNALAKMDPLQDTTTALLKQELAAFEESDCDEELEYRTRIAEIMGPALSRRAATKIELASMLAEILVQYDKAKATLFDWPNDNVAKSAVFAMCRMRAAARRTLEFLRRDFGMTFEDLLSDEGMSIWMLNPRNLDECGRSKRVKDPELLSRFARIVNDDILSDASIPDIAMR